MNIFATSNDPVSCAMALDDRRLNKMCLETAQLICTAAHINRLPYRIKYAPTHEKHPCARWAAASAGNLEWLCIHFEALCDEWLDRFNKTHACVDAMESLIDNLTLYEFKDEGPKPFVNCARNIGLGLDFTHIADVHEAYRQYLIKRWAYEIKDFMGSRKGYYPRWGDHGVPTWAAALLDAMLMRERV